MYLQQLIKTILGVTENRAKQIAVNLELANDNTKIITDPALNIRKVSEQSLITAGLTDRQATKLVAALELGRLAYSQAVLKSKIVDDHEIASQFFMPLLGWKEKEHAAVLVMNVKLMCLATEVISIGTSTECIFSPKEVFRTVLRHGGSRVIVAHNHPSGYVEPSEEDIKLTKILIDASEVMDIQLLDHLVIGNGTYHSIRQHTMLWDKYRKLATAA